METVVSGIRSTGNLHLGNYFGALRNFITMQDSARCFFFIADYHSLTTHPDPKILHGNVRNILCEYLAAGLDPERSTIYVQSDCPELTELYLLLNMHAYTGELERTASFKDKVRKQQDNVNAGLLTYPVLMAADILVHRADKVPVGKDQEQHLEMTRKFARRFNNLYGVDFFPEPVAYNFGSDLVKIPGLDGSGKMGKSEGNGIYLIDTDEVIRKKVMRAVTDGGPVAVTSSPNGVLSQSVLSQADGVDVSGLKMSDGVANIFAIMDVVSQRDVVEHFRGQYAQGTIRYGDLKKQLAEDIISVVSPIRARILDISGDDAYLARVTRLGAERARESAVSTVEQVRSFMGIHHF